MTQWIASSMEHMTGRLKDEEFICLLVYISCKEFRHCMFQDILICLYYIIFFSKK